MNVVRVVQVFKDRNLVAQLVRKAKRAGYKAIVLTADTPRLGRREADIKNRWAVIQEYHVEIKNKLDNASIFHYAIRYANYFKVWYIFFKFILLDEVLKLSNVSSQVYYATIFNIKKLWK